MRRFGNLIGWLRKRRKKSTRKKKTARNNKRSVKYLMEEVEKTKNSRKLEDILGDLEAITEKKLNPGNFETVGELVKDLKERRETLKANDKLKNRLTRAIKRAEEKYKRKKTRKKKKKKRVKKRAARTRKRAKKRLKLAKKRSAR